MVSLKEHACVHECTLMLIEVNPISAATSDW